MILLDTTVLVYAVGREHLLQPPCRRVIELVADGAISATTTVEAVQEFVHVRARRRSRRDAIELGRAYATLLAPLVRPDGDDLALGLELYEDHEGLGAFDAVLAATARRAGAAALVSADVAFAGIPDLPHLNPAADDFEHQLLATT